MGAVDGPTDRVMDYTGDIMITTFEDCLFPSDVRTFIQDVFGAKVAHYPGRDDRFSDLVSVGELNGVLSRLVVYDGMMRLMHSAPELNQDAVKDYVKAMLRRHPRKPQRNEQASQSTD